MNFRFLSGTLFLEDTGVLLINAEKDSMMRFENSLNKKTPKGSLNETERDEGDWKERTLARTSPLCGVIYFCEDLYEA